MLSIGGLLLSDFTFDFDIKTGVFGFLREEHIVFTICVLGLFTGAT